MSEVLKSKLPTSIYDAVLAHAERAVEEGRDSLIVNGTATVEVTLTVTGTVDVDFNDITVAELDRLELRIDDDGYHVVVSESAEGGKVDEYDLRDPVTYDYNFSRKVERLDIQDVEVYEAEVSDWVIDEIDLDYESQQELDRWNERGDS